MLFPRLFHATITGILPPVLTKITLHFLYIWGSTGEKPTFFCFFVQNASLDCNDWFWEIKKQPAIFRLFLTL